MKKAVSLMICLMIIMNVLVVPAFALSEPEDNPFYEMRNTSGDRVEIETLKEILSNAFHQCETVVDISSFNIKMNDENIAVLCDLIYDELPECFHIKKFTYWYASGKLTKIQPTYKVSASEYQQMYSEFVQAKEKMLEGIKDNPALGDVEKALLIHDRLALACEYDYNKTEDRYNGYGALVKGAAVCQGYSEAYDYLLEEVGIQSYLCDSEELNHAWNIIDINGNWYHVDVTWDDCSWDQGERGVPGAVSHKNFLRSSEGFYSYQHDATDYCTIPSDTTYDQYFWQNSKTAFQLVDNELYYIDQETSSIRRYGDGEALCSVSAQWKTEGRVWRNQARLATDGQNLYYSLSKSVYKYDFSTQTPTKVLEPAMSDSESIYGFAYEDGYLMCDINNSPPYFGDISHLTQVRELYDLRLPVGSVTSTNHVSAAQMVTIHLSDNAGIAGYYWGTREAVEENVYTPTDSDTVTKEIRQSGTYYLTVKDIAGNVSQTETITFYKTELKDHDVLGTPEYILTPSGSSFRFPAVSMVGYEYQGWSASAADLTGSEWLTPAKDEAYYAIFEKLPVVKVEIICLPAKTSYQMEDAFDGEGLEISITYGDGSTCKVTDGFTIGGFDTASPGQKTVSVFYEGVAATFTITVQCSHARKTEIAHQSPGCVVSGNNQYFICDLCGVVFQADGMTQTTAQDQLLPPLGHDFADATCTQPQTCLVCGITEGSAIGHSYGSVVTSETCTTDGYTTYTCSRCTDSYRDAYVEATGHDFQGGPRCVHCGEKSPNYAQLSGSVTGVGTGSTLLELLREGEDTPAAVVEVMESSGSYSFPDLTAGSYILRVSRPNHVTRIHTVVLPVGDQILDVQIHLLGDANGDGSVNIGDVAMVYTCVKLTTPLAEEYQFQCANVIGDDRINIGDAGRIYSHVKDTFRLW